MNSYEANHRPHTLLDCCNILLCVIQTLYIRCYVLLYIIQSPVTVTAYCYLS